MTTFVLGAGASLHAGYPLAAKLGTALRDWIHANKAPEHDYRIHIDQLDQLYGGLGNIEQILTDFDDSAPDSPLRSVQAPIGGNLLHDLRFSIREFFADRNRSRTDLYSRFARERVKESDVLITFNYEWSLERELKKAGLWEIDNGYGFSIGVSGIGPSKVAVLKLHGSINWWGLKPSVHCGFSPNLLTKPVILQESDFEAIGYTATIADPACSGISVVEAFPCIIMPTRCKQFYFETIHGPELQEFWEGLWKQAKCALQSSEEIVIIGFSMAEADKRAANLLLKDSNHDAHITICSGQSNSSLAQKFRTHGFQRITATTAHFEDYLDA